VPASTVFLVGNDGYQLDVLALNLKLDGFEAVLFSQLGSAYEQLETYKPDLLILDLLAHDPSAFSICKDIRSNREKFRTLVLLLSNNSSDIQASLQRDRIFDQHMIKPYSVFEVILQARRLTESALPRPPEEILRIGNLQVLLREHRVTYNSKLVGLGPTEFRLLVQLMKRPGYVWTREELLATVWGGRLTRETNTVEIHIGRLRKALCQVGHIDPIRTLRGLGYCVDSI
jgi:two-component system phosphate regulon response regulator PhoB